MQGDMMLMLFRQHVDNEMRCDRRCVVAHGVPNGQLAYWKLYVTGLRRAGGEVADFDRRGPRAGGGAMDADVYLALTR